MYIQPLSILCYLNLQLVMREFNSSTSLFKFILFESYIVNATEHQEPRFQTIRVALVSKFSNTEVVQFLYKTATVFKITGNHASFFADLLQWLCPDSHTHSRHWWSYSRTGANISRRSRIEVSRISMRGAEYLSVNSSLAIGTQLFLYIKTNHTGRALVLLFWSVSYERQPLVFIGWVCIFISRSV